MLLLVTGADVLWPELRVLLFETLVLLLCTGAFVTDCLVLPCALCRATVFLLPWFVLLVTEALFLEGVLVLLLSATCI